jgi:hypothetical protein
LGYTLRKPGGSFRRSARGIFRQLSTFSYENKPPLPGFSAIVQEKGATILVAAPPFGLNHVSISYKRTLTGFFITPVSKRLSQICARHFLICGRHFQLALRHFQSGLPHFQIG